MSVVRGSKGVRFHTVNIVLTRDLTARLDEEAQRLELSRSATIRVALNEYLRRAKEQERLQGE